MCFKGNTPKHAFTMWTAHLDNLPTRARLAAWGMLTPTSWCLCMGFDKNRDHLFLTCDYSTHSWQQAQARLHNLPCIFHSWTSLMVWAKHGFSTSPSILRKLVDYNSRCLFEIAYNRLD